MWVWISKIVAKAKKAKKGIQHKGPRLVAGVVGVLGGVLMLVPLFWDVPTSNLGGILFGSGFAYLLFQREFEKDMRTDMKKLHKDVGHIDKDVDKIDKAIHVAEGAIESGLVAIYATREDCLKEIKKTLEEALKSIKQGKRKGRIKVSLLGETLGDFLTTPGKLWHTFQKVLGSNAFIIELAILEDGCKAAHCRARVEEESRYKSWDPERDECKVCEQGPLPCLDFYQNATCHRELMTVTGCLKKLDRGRPIEPDGWEPTYVMKAKLKAFTYKILPMVFMFQMDNHMFVEQYHLGSRGGQTPILHIHQHRNEQDTKESQLFRIFMDHFESVRRMSKEIELGSSAETVQQGA